MLLRTAERRSLGRAFPRLRFAEAGKTEKAWAGRRVLVIDGRPAFELSFWCGTCPFLFKRLEGASDRLSIARLQERLADGLDDVDDDVVDAFAALLPEGSYIPMLLEVQPRLVLPVTEDDYFAHEQVDTWGIDSFWGLPEYPQTPYYRTFETAVDADSHLFEFIVPMVPPSWNDKERVAQHVERLRRSSMPTAVAVSTLDVCAPAVDDRSNDYFAHWGLSHFLLDGHHKAEAAASLGSRMRVLSLLAVEASLASPDDVASVPRRRGAAAVHRHAPNAR